MTPQDWSPEHDRRSETRRHLLFATTVRSDGDGEPQPVLVRDISARGLLLEVEDGAVLNHDFHITLPDAGEVEAHVIWQGDKLAGCRLESHLSQSTIDLVKESGEHDHNGRPEDDDQPIQSAAPRTAARTLAARLKQLRIERDLTRANWPTDRASARPAYGPGKPAGPCRASRAWKRWRRVWVFRCPIYRSARRLHLGLRAFPMGTAICMQCGCPSLSTPASRRLRRWPARPPTGSRSPSPFKDRPQAV